MLRALPFVVALMLPLLSQAHDGHGAPGVSHWHATDTWGMLVALGGVAAVMWFGRRK